MRLFVDNHPTHKTASFHKQRKKNLVKQKSKKKQKGLRIGVARIKLLPLGHRGSNIMSITNFPKT